MALWVEKHHKERGAEFIAEKIAALAEADDVGGVKLWEQVARRYAQLSPH